MKKNLAYLVLFLLLTVAVMWMMRNGGLSTLKSDLKNFALADTGIVTKIILTDKEGNKVTLERKAINRWRVNNKYEVNQVKMNTLLETMKTVEVKSPVPAKDESSVVIDLATRHTFVQVYKGDDMIKSYFVGVQTTDQLGTYMLMENSKSPFITHIPGFNGYLTVRYFTKELDWKTRKVFDSKTEDLEFISVTYPANAEESFVVSNDGGKLTVVPQAVKHVSGPVNMQFLSYYAASFRSIMYEGYDQAFDSRKADSVAALTPYCIMVVKNKNGEKNALRIFYKGIDERTMQQFDEKTKQPLSVDPERYFALLNNEKNLVIIQQYVFGNLLRSYSDFLVKQNSQAGTSQP